MHEHAEKLPLTSSFLSEMDPRIKILTVIYFIFVISICGVDSHLSFYLFGFILIVLALLSKISLTIFLKRYLIILPFLIVIIALLPFSKEGKEILSLDLKFITLQITDLGMKTFFNVFIKSFLSISALIILSATTSFADSIKALKALKVPLMIITILSFMYRYLYLMVEEVRNMKMAVDARDFGRNKIVRLKALAGAVAVFFLRSYERSESIYYAMVSRNFDRNYFLKTNYQPTVKDVISFVVFLAVVSEAYLLGR